VIYINSDTFKMLAVSASPYVSQHSARLSVSTFNYFSVLDFEDDINDIENRLSCDRDKTCTLSNDHCDKSVATVNDKCSPIMYNDSQMTKYFIQNEFKEANDDCCIVNVINEYKLDVSDIVAEFDNTDKVKSAVNIDKFSLRFILSISILLNMCAFYLLYLSTNHAWFKDKGLKIAHLNVNRIMGKLDQIKLTLDDKTPGIFCLSETFLTDQADDRLLAHVGYQLERKDRVGKIGGGLLCYIKDAITYERRNDLENSDIEIIWLEVKYATSKNILTGFFYRPPSANSDWLNTFSEDLELIHGEGKEIILMGDMNINLKNSTTNTLGNTRKLLNILDSVNLKQVISEFTRVSSNTKTLIDHAYVSNPKAIIHTAVPVYGVSDHYPICITRKYTKTRAKTHGKQICYRNMNNFNIDTFMNDMFNVSWNDVKICTSPDEALAVWSLLYQSVIDKHMPLIHKRVKRLQQPKWMNKEIQLAIHTRDYMKKRQSFVNYRYWRNRVVNLIKSSKKKLYVEAIAANKRNPTLLWKHLKGLCPDKQRKTVNNLNIDGKIITKETDMADALNSFYANVSSKYISSRTNNLDKDVAENIVNFVNEKVQENTSFTLSEMSIDFTLKQLNIMSNSKATGLDGFSVNILKMAAPAIVDSITHICNLSIRTKSFPDKWKEARVTPIFKKGKADECSNYRPVSVLPILSKIIEKHVYLCLYDFLQRHKLLLDTQFGFRKNQSCQTALITLTEGIYKAIKNGDYFGMVQLDLSKAFDLVNHSLLLEKLKLYHCNNGALAWFQSYLQNRSQRVRIENALSHPQIITSGVPQGSILGPLLFLIYINDLPMFVKKLNMILYADDATIPVTGKNVLEIQNELCQDGNSSSDWCVRNDMLLSLPKCNSIIVSTRQKRLHNKQPVSLDVQINGITIPCVSSTKLLGVHIDNVMCWDEHIRVIHNKIVRNLYLLRQIKQYLPVEARKLFVNSYILPHIDYCCIVWGNCTQILLNKLEKLLKRAARLILDEVLDRENTTPSHVLFSTLRWMSLTDRINYHRAIQMYKCLNGVCSEGMSEMFAQSSQVHNHNTRAAIKNNLYVTHHHSKSFAHLGTTVWNDIPTQIRNSKSLATFKVLYMNQHFINSS